MKIVGITGPAGAGKDTVADYLVARYGYTKLSFASTLKDMLRVMGFPEPLDRADKERTIPGFDFSWREAAQRLGTEFGRGLDPDIWVKIVARNLRRHSDRIVMSDVRFENEAAMIRLNGKMLFMSGRAADLGSNAAHASEAGVEYHPTVDSMIDNSAKLDWTYQQVRTALGYPT